MQIYHLLIPATDKGDCKLKWCERGIESTNNSTTAARWLPCTAGKHFNIAFIITCVLALSLVLLH